MSKSFLSILLSVNLGLLKVLDLEYASLEAIPNEIFKFIYLKYLSFKRTNVKTIPELIGKLQKLETLDLTCTNVEKLPVEILKLQNLRHLLMGSPSYGDGVQFAHTIGNLQCLQSLHKIDADQIGNINIVKEIGKLSQLRKLGIVNLRREDGEELCSSFENLTNLRSLWLHFRYGEVIDLQYPLSSTPEFLRSLSLKGRLEKLPQWIDSLRGLTKVILIGNALRDDPLPLIQDLPNLVQLTLWEACIGEGLCFKNTKFQKLKLLRISFMEALRWVRVEKGAMPFLEELRLGRCEFVNELPEGIEHLTSLQLFYIYKMSDRFVKNVEDKMKERKTIAHIPRVEIVERVNGELQQ